MCKSILEGGHQMTKYREILRLLSNKLKTDEIVQASHVSKKTVINFMVSGTINPVSCHEWPQ